MYTTDDHKEKIYEEIRDLMKLCDSYENEVTAISNGTMYLVEDYCTAGTFDSEERLQNKLYINNIQIMASRIRIMADKINSTLIQPITDMTYDPSEQTQIFLEEILLRINELTHSIKTSYNNIRLLYQYMTGKAPESHSIECVIIPYLNFSSIIEEKDGEDNDNSDVESDYPHIINTDVRKVLEAKLKEMVRFSENGIIAVVDKNTWKLDGLASNYGELPIKCSDPNAVWIVAEDFELEFEDESDYNKVELYHYDSSKACWVPAYNNPHSGGFEPNDIAVFLQATAESNCRGRVDDIDCLPKNFRVNSEIFSDKEKFYFRFIEDHDTAHWLNTAFDNIDLAPGNRLTIDNEKLPDSGQIGDIVNTPKASYVWYWDKWTVHDVWLH